MAKHKMVVILDNVRSAYNVGSAFRTCESAGVEKLGLTGICAVPPNKKLTKTALGAIDNVKWEHHCEALGAIKYYQSQGYKIIAFETGEMATNWFDDWYKSLGVIDGKVALVFGSETEGVSDQVLAMADIIVMIPQYGKKESLNVASAVAIGVYGIIERGEKLYVK